MVKVCSNGKCTNILLENQIFYYCCDESLRYCRSCSQNLLCKTCGKDIKNVKTLTVCRMCDDDLNLLRCKCGVICRACHQTQQRLSMTICKICRQVPATITNTFHQPKRSKILCDNCQREIGSCICKKINSPPTINSSSLNSISSSPKPVSSSQKPISSSPKPLSSSPKPKQKQQCGRCYRRQQVDQMYCNYCGHFICKTCLNDPKFAFICKSVGCNQPILREGLDDFIKIGKNCQVCEKPLLDDKNKSFGPQNNMCQTCYKLMKETQTQSVKTDSTQIPKQQAFQSSKIDTKIDNRSGVSIVNKENVGSSPSPSPQITEKHYSSALPRSPRQFDNVQLNVPPSTVNNRYLSPNVPSNVRADNIMKTPQKRQTQGSAKPSPSSKLASPYPDGREKSRSNTSSMADPTIPMPCSSCKIPYLSRSLMTTNCKNKHKMCRFCTLKFRGKECDVCKVVEQQHLNKYFCYKQLTGEERQAFTAKLGQEAMGLCYGCNIILLKNRTIIQKGKSYCKFCLLRIK